MDNIRRTRLNTYREDIVKDLDVKYIIDVLISNNVITINESDVFFSNDKREDKVRLLLNKILTKGNEAYDIFVDALIKDYNWLAVNLKITENSVHKDTMKETLEDCLSRGEIPRLPIHYVPRIELEKEIHSKLDRLNRHEMLVLHGMPGSGKSSLAVGALRSNASLVVNNFDGLIFWINVGDCITPEQIITLQSKIYTKLTTINNDLQDVSNKDLTFFDLNNSQSTLSCLDNTPNYRDLLRKAFEESFRKALIVIDDLKTKEVVEEFDIGCKIMITTQHIDIIKSFNPIIIQVPNNFKDYESMQLLALCVGKQQSELPAQAMKIHARCKGAPLLIAMIGSLLADNKERLNHDESHWNDYVKQLKNKDLFFLRKTNEEKKPYLTIEMCIKSLEDKYIIETYKLLAVLPENAKVSSKALSVILNVPDQSSLDRLMKKLKNNSLVMEHYNPEQKSYQYEVHDLIMAYLKSCHTELELRKLHANLLDRYQNICVNKSLVNLPDDGYIVYYIGYHIHNAHNYQGMSSLFHSLFTNLIFIGNKIRLAGCSDVLRDLNVYSKDIIKKSSDQDFLHDLANFIQRFGQDLHRYPNTDIIQSVIQHCSNNILYVKASEIIQSHDFDKFVYFHFQPEDEAEESNFTILDVADNITCLKFWLNFILLGCENGNVGLWCLNTNKKLKSFISHKKPINAITTNEINTTPSKMATLSEDGSIRLWSLEDIHVDSDNESLENGDSFPTYCDSYESSLIYHDNEMCQSGHWGHKHSIFLVHTNPGNSIYLYDSNGDIVQNIKLKPDISISSTALSIDDTLIMCGYEILITEKFAVSIYVTKSGDNLMTFFEHAPIIMLAPVPGENNCVLTLTKVHLQKHKWNRRTPTLNEAKSNLVHTKIADLEGLQNDYQFQTAAIAEDGSCVFISTTDGRVLVYNLKTNISVWELNNYRGIVSSLDTKIYTYYDDMTYSHLVATLSNGEGYSGIVKLWGVYCWQISPASDIYKRSNLTMKFDCIFDKRQQTTPISTNSQLSSESIQSSIKRAETLDTASKNNNAPKLVARKTISLDRYSIKPLNLKGCSMFTNDANHHNPIIAAIDSSNKIQVLRGKKLFAETPISESAINIINISPCGTFLIYGQENGHVYKFIFMSRVLRKIMDLNDSVHYLDFVKDTKIIAAGKNGGLMLYELDNGESVAKMIIQSRSELGSQELIDSLNGKRRIRSEVFDFDKKSSPPSISSFSSQDNIVGKFDGFLCKPSAVIKCFWIEDIGLLSITKDCSVKLWNLSPNILNVLVSRRNDVDIFCALMHKLNLLVLLDRKGYFFIYNISKENIGQTPALCASLYDSKDLNKHVECCTLSSDGKVLAVGYHSGDILLYNVVNRSTVSLLKLHKTPVKSLKFSPGSLMNNSTSTSSFSPKSSDSESPSESSIRESPFILVSMAGQITFWDVMQIFSRKNKVTKQPGIGSVLKVLSPKPIMPKSNTNLFDPNHTVEGNGSCFEFPDKQWEKPWRKKASRSNSSKEILACIKLTGERASKLLIDEKFSKFITIDQSGVVYIMNILDNYVTTNGFEPTNNI